MRDMRANVVFSQEGWRPVLASGCSPGPRGDGSLFQVNWPKIISSYFLCKILPPPFLILIGSWQEGSTAPSVMWLFQPKLACVLEVGPGMVRETEEGRDIDWGWRGRRAFSPSS